MEYIVGPLFGGLIFYVLMTILISLGGFMFKLKVLKLGDFSQYNKTQILLKLGQPNNTLNIENDNSQLIWLKSSGNYLLKIDFDSKGDFLRISQQIDQTTSGVKGFIYGLILKYK